jgi:hypothetical protein
MPNASTRVRIPMPRNPGPVIVQWYLPHDLKFHRHIRPAANQPAVIANWSYPSGIRKPARTIYTIIDIQVNTVMSLPLTDSIFNFFVIISLSHNIIMLHICLIPNRWGITHITIEGDISPSMKRAALEFNYEAVWKEIFGSYAGKVDVLEALKCFKCDTQGLIIISRIRLKDKIMTLKQLLQGNGLLKNIELLYKEKDGSLVVFIEGEPCVSSPPQECSIQCNLLSSTGIFG